MNVLYDTNTDFWIEFARELQQEAGFVPVFWICDHPEEVKKAFPGCISYFVWDAFKLSKMPSEVEVEERVSYTLIPQLSLEAYYNYIKLLDRVDHQGAFSFSERDRLFKDHLNYWHAVLTTLDIQFVVMSNLPHLPYNYPLYLVAKALGIPLVFANTTPFSGWHFFLHELSAEAYAVAFQRARETLPADRDVNATHAQDLVFKAKTTILERYSGSKPQYMVKQNRADSRWVNKYSHVFPVTEAHQILARIKRRKFSGFFQAGGKAESIKQLDRHYADTTITTFEYARRVREAAVLRRTFRSEMAAYSSKPDFTKKYVFVPLHYQPEATSAPMGGYFADQLMLIEMLSDHLPDGWRICVKEHTSQFSTMLWGHQGRSPGYYRSIAAIPNVDLVDINTDSATLIDHCQAVATVTGTAGWEAIARGKPTLVFGLAWYALCEGAYPVRTREDLKAAFNIIQNGVTVQAEHVDRFIQEFACFAFRSDLHGYAKGEIDSDPKFVSGRFLAYARGNHLLDKVVEQEG